MSKASEQYERRATREFVQNVLAEEQAKSDRRLAALADHRGYQAMLKDLEWIALDREWRAVVVRFEKKRARFKGKWHTDLTPAQRAVFEKVDADYERELTSFLQQVCVFKRHYGIPEPDRTRTVSAKDIRRRAEAVAAYAGVKLPPPPADERASTAAQSVAHPTTDTSPATTAGEGRGKSKPGKRGRRPKTKPDKIDRVVCRMLDSGDVACCKRSWKELHRRYTDQLPKHIKTDALRKRVEREEARRQADDH